MKNALCLSGIVGGTSGKDGRGERVDVGLCADYYRRYVIEPNRCEVFIYTWSVECEDELRRLYRPKSSRFQTQVDFRQTDKMVTRTRFNMLSKWYSTIASFNLCKQSGFYDFVMLGRLDMMPLEVFDFSRFDASFLYVPPLAVDHDAPRWVPPKRVNISEEKHQLHDVYCVASFDVMDTVLNAKPSDWPKRSSDSPHKAWWQRVNDTLGRHRVRFLGWRGEHWDLYRWRVCRSTR